ncbi:hypothetical protein Ocin01_12863 [Orchesella cincta]|uniref:CBM6 domain-containing protein n=1 Tax=Orchesella cincta TaxID=48709 RepID=A0A1D2MLC9_ORCCI|nr:hypothetical protein Ocin01_12863 [Orchesella cincta]
MKQKYILFVCLVQTLLFRTTHALSIFPGDAYWADTSGVPIQAHGGGFLKLGDTYYWFGEDKTEGGHLFHYVNCYKSTDLVNWEYVSHALSADEGSGSEIGSDAVVERPKVIYNERNQQFVMWFHLDSSNYGLAKLGIAVSNTVQGPYQYQGSVSPFDEDSRDMTVWVDEADTAKSAYLVYATRVNLDTVIAKLSPDYLSIQERLLKLDGIHREAYAVFKKNDLYYIVMSRATGWDSNSNEYMYSRSMSGPWSERFQIAPGSSNTFDSQSNYVIPLPNGNFIFAGDRWNRNDLSDSRYMWLPINIGSNNDISIHWTSQFSLDMNTGSASNRSSRAYDSRSPEADLVGNAVVMPCSGCDNGDSVGYIGLGGKLAFRGVYGSQTATHSVLISYANGDSTRRYATLNVNNGAWERNITFPKSGGGQVTKQIVVHVPLNQGAVNELEISNEVGYAPDIDFLKIEFMG